LTLLVLFDVDRTLFVSSDSLYGKALATAVHEVYGLGGCGCGRGRAARAARGAARSDTVVA
jgi:hypothetical protein